MWTPKDGGSYLLCYQIVTEAGEVYQSFIGYEITEPKVDIKGISVSEPNTKGEITLKANVDTNDSNLKYTYKAYDMEIGLQFQKRTIVIRLHGSRKQQEVIFCIWR